MLIFPFTLKGIALFDILFSKFITINSTSFLYSSFALFIYATIYKAYKKYFKSQSISSKVRNKTRVPTFTITILK